MGTDPRRKAEYTAFIEPISWAKILRLHEKGLLQEQKNLQNLPVAGLEPCVLLAESVLTTGLFKICNRNVFVII